MVAVKHRDNTSPIRMEGVGDPKNTTTALALWIIPETLEIGELKDHRRRRGRSGSLEQKKDLLGVASENKKVAMESGYVIARNLKMKIY